MTAAPDKLRDVHAPARFIGGEIHWQMASGPDAIDASIAATALHLLGPEPFPGYLEAFERHRAVLCELAARKFSPRTRQRKVEISRDEILQIVGQRPLRTNKPDERARSP